MITLKNGFDTSGNKFKTFSIPSGNEIELDVTGLTLIPSLIDPHVHFRVPGAEHKENWITGAQAAINGGVSCVFDMPNNIPACSSYERLIEKRKLIDSQLNEINIPLHYGLYFGADKNHLKEISKAKDLIIGIKVFMGCSTGDLLIDDDSSLAEVFRIGANEDLIVAVHAEDEARLHERKKLFIDSKDPSIHSRIRDPECARIATQKAIEMCQKFNARLYVLHMSTKEEVDLVKQAKKAGISVFAEACTHHLFLSEKDYASWGTKVQMNPPLRTFEDQEALWKGINDGTIDTIGTDHAPHTLSEKALPFGKAPSGIPGVETLLPLLLNAVHEKKITLSKLVELTRKNIEKIFNLAQGNDFALIDLNYCQKVSPTLLKSKCGWTPFEGQTLKGWPIYTILQGRIFKSAGFNPLLNNFFT